MVTLAIIAGGIYAAVVYVPIVSDNFDVKEAMSIAFNNLRTHDDEAIRTLIQQKLTYIGTHKETDGFGNVQEVTGLGLTDEDIQIERDEVRGTVKLVIDYRRELRLKPTEKVTSVHFHNVKEGPLPK